MKSLEAFSESFEKTLNMPDDKVKKLRIKSFDEFNKVGIPNRKNEYWKFSDPSSILKSNLEFSDSVIDIDDDYNLSLIHI